MLSEKKPVTKDNILHDFIYFKCLESANLWRQKVNQWLPGAGESEGIRESWLKGVGFLFGLINVLKLIVVIDVNILCEYTKSH